VAGGPLGIGEKASGGLPFAPCPLAGQSADGGIDPGSRLGQPADHRAVVVVHPDEEAIHAQETLEAYEPHRDGHQRQQAQPEEEPGPDPEVTEPWHQTARAAETSRPIRLMFGTPIAE
jgi:hypothetical protein